MAEVIILGAGVAGAAAAGVLARAGIDVAIVDPRHPVAPMFRAEILGGEHVGHLARLGLLPHIRPVATRIGTVEEACLGVRIRRFSADHLALSFDTLVNALRAAMPASVDFRIARVNAVETGPESCRVDLDDGSSLTARLVIVATGAGSSPVPDLERRIISRMHSLTFGATIAPLPGNSFDFDELTYWGDSDASRIVLATLFPLGSAKRLNVVAHWDIDDPRVAEMRADPDAALARLLPRLQRVTGRFALEGKVEICPVNIHAVEGHLRPGLVVIGDSHSVACPAVGTGVAKALNDVEVLASDHLPRWLAGPRIDVDQIAAYYGDPRKVRVDRGTLERSLRTRRTAIDPGSRWRARRAVRLAKRHLVAAICRVGGADNALAKALSIAAHDGPLQLLRQARASLLNRLLGRVHRHSSDAREVAGTSDVVALADLTIASDNAGDGVHYAPTPGPIVDWLHRLLPSAFGDWTFIDLGCGYGRVVAGAARRPWRKVIGVDFAAECCERARANIAALAPGSLRAREVEIRHGDAAQIELPDGPCVIYLFNPFGARVLARMLGHLAAQLAASPRPVVIAYFNPEADSAFRAFPAFSAVRLPLAERARFALLSPYRLKLYANAPGRAALRAGRLSAGAQPGGEPQLSAP